MAALSCRCETGLLSTAQCCQLEVWGKSLDHALQGLMAESDDDGAAKCERGFWTAHRMLVSGMGLLSIGGQKVHQLCRCMSDTTLSAPGALCACPGVCDGLSRDNSSIIWALHSCNDSVAFRQSDNTSNAEAIMRPFCCTSCSQQALSTPASRSQVASGQPVRPVSPVRSIRNGAI